MSNEKVIAFANYFKSLSEKEQYAVGKQFNQETGGKLSAHNNPTPITVALLQVLDDDDGSIKLLGIKRGIEPHIGGLALPGGYLDRMEEGHVGVAREVLEETGLSTNPEDYQVLGNPLLSHMNNVLIFYKNKNIFPKSIMEELKINHEVTGFELIDLDSELCFTLHQQKVQEFLSSPEVANIERISKKIGLKKNKAKM